NRTVEIYGAGRDNTIIDIQTRKDCQDVEHNQGDGMGFVVYAPHVTIHDLALRGHQGNNGVGNCGEGIKFMATADFGLVHDIKASSFGAAGIDVFEAQGVYIHDNFIDCNGGDGTGQVSSATSMG